MPLTPQSAPSSFASGVSSAFGMCFGAAIATCTVAAAGYALYQGNAWMLRQAMAKPTNWWAVVVCAAIGYLELTLGFKLLVYSGIGFVVILALLTGGK